MSSDDKEIQPVQPKPTGTLPSLAHWVEHGIKLPEQIVSQSIITRKGTTILAAPEDSFKSQLAIQLAVCGSSGKQWLTFDCVKGRVVYLIMEGDPNVTFERMHEKAMKLGVTSEALANINANMFIGEPIDEEATLIKLDGMLAPLKPVDLLILDPITYRIAGDVRYNPVMNMAMDNLETLALKYNMGVMAVIHTRKGTKSVNDLDNIIGGRVVSARASTRIMMMRNGDAAEIAFWTRMSERPDKLDLIWKHPLLEVQGAILKQVERAKNKVIEILKIEKVVPLKKLLEQVSQEVEVNEKTVRSAISALETKGLVKITREPKKPDKIVAYLGD